MARKRHNHEETIYNECLQNIHRIGDREASMHSCIAEVDEKSENEHQTKRDISISSSQNERKGMEELA